MAAPLFLIGFMAAGKTSVGRAIAEATGRPFVDLDDTIELGDAKSVADLVARDEAAFRERETEALRNAIAGAGANGTVIATGGGCAAHGSNLAAMRASGCVVALGVDLTDALKRASEQGTPRPLLAQADRRFRERARFYRGANAVVDTTQKSVGQVAREVAAVERAWQTEPHATMVALGERSYPIRVVDGVADGWSGIAPTSRDVVITDRNVAAHHDLPACADRTIAIEPGEASKSFAIYESLCAQLVARGLDRSSTIYALGGGVVGDLAGFVAATLYRGIAVVQLPTTLVAMTDSAIGGKTAVDLPAGKNLVGAFHQPRLVHANLHTLTTLPVREYRAGFGELWKYALLDGEALWGLVEGCAASTDRSGQLPAELRDVIDVCIQYKAALVGRDERERTGHRALLNLGHTVGHAIETTSGLHHGEAVGLGLVAACRVSAALRLTTGDIELRTVEALRRTGLPHELSRYLTDDTLAHIAVDKKRVGDNVRFIAIREVGVCEPVEVPLAELRRILRSVPSA